MAMEEMVRRLKTVKQCENLEKNTSDRGREDYATLARIRALEIKAEEYGASNDAEKEALQAVYAYEKGLSKQNGKATKASKTWPLVRRHGIIEAVERTVNQKSAISSFEVLAELGLMDFAFEAVILRHPELFSDEAIKISEERLAAV